MSDLTKRQRELAETRLAAAQDRPVRICPNCNAIGARHFIPAHLDAAGIVPSRYTCEGASA